jgi:hypothetical protein
VVEILLESGKLFDDNPACLLYLYPEVFHNRMVL